MLASYARRARRLGVEPAHLGGYPGRLGALQARLSAAVTTLAEVAQRAIDGELTRPETQLMTQLGAGS